MKSFYFALKFQLGYYVSPKLYWKGEDKVMFFPLVFYNLTFYTI